MIYSTDGAIWTFASTDCRISFFRTADMVTVIVVAILCGSFIAWNISALDKLLDWDRVLLTIHITCDNYWNVSIFRGYDFSFGQNQSDLSGSSHRAPCTASPFHHKCVFIKAKIFSSDFLLSTAEVNDLVPLLHHCSGVYL